MVSYQISCQYSCSPPPPPPPHLCSLPPSSLSLSLSLSPHSLSTPLSLPSPSFSSAKKMRLAIERIRYFHIVKAKAYYLYWGMQQPTSSTYWPLGIMVTMDSTFRSGAGSRIMHSVGGNRTWLSLAFDSLKQNMHRQFKVNVVTLNMRESVRA